MKINDKLLQWLKRPHGLLLFAVYLVTVIASAAAIVLAIARPDNVILEVLSYACYAVAAISLGYSTYTIVIYAPTMKSSLTATLKKNGFIAKLMENYGFKTLTFSLFSLIATGIFVGVNLGGAIRYGLIWYYAISGYYVILLLFRGVILYADLKCRKKYVDSPLKLKNKKWSIYVSGGILLSLLEIAMAVAVTEMMISGRSVKSGAIMAITNAAYTFYKMTMAIYNLIKARKFNDPTVQALRNINFADACMALVSLTVILLSTFGEPDADSGLIILKALVGFAACAVIIAMAIRMVVVGHKQKKLTKGK